VTERREPRVTWTAPRRWVWCVLAAALFAPAAARAQVTVTLRPLRDSVAVGDILRVNAEIVSTIGSPEAVSNLPATGFVQLGTMQSQSMEFSFGFGNQPQRLRLVRTFTLQAQTPGLQTLGPLQVQVGSQVFSSGTVQLRVSPGAGNQAVPSPGLPTPLTPGVPVPGVGSDTEQVPFSVCRMPDGSPVPEAGADGPVTCIVAQPDMFLQVEVTDVRVYLGEPLQLQIRAFVERDMVGFSLQQLFSQMIRKEPSLEGFLRTNLETGKLEVEPQRVQGRLYLWTTLRDKLLYPTRAGRLEIGPAEAVLNSMDFFNPTRVRRQTPAIPIEVLPLPATGRPADFSPNNVGAQLSVSLDVAPRSLQVGQSLQITLRLAGEGNLAGFQIPVPQLPGATVLKSDDKVEEPTADHLTGSRAISFLVTPSAPGTLDLSALAVTYFDFIEERYAMARPEPVQVAVAPAPPGTPLPAAATPEGPAAGQPTASMRPWNDLSRPSAPWHDHPLFWVLFLLPPASLAGLYVVGAAAGAVRRRRGVVRPADVYRRSTAVLRRVAKGRGTGDAVAQLGAVEAALLAYLEARMGEPLRGYATAELQRRLVVAGFSDTLVSRLVAQLETCAFGCFAPSASRQQGASEAARGALDVLRDLERAKASPAAEARP